MRNADRFRTELTLTPKHALLKLVFAKKQPQLRTHRSTCRTNSLISVVLEKLGAAKKLEIE
jgi:hypothetical protein